MSVIENYKNLSKIDLRNGIVNEENDSKYPFSPSTKQALEKLKAFLGPDAKEVIPQFTLVDGKAVLDNLMTGPDMFAVNALNKLKELIAGTELAKTDASHDFNREQTAAIVAASPAVGRRPSATD